LAIAAQHLPTLFAPAATLPSFAEAGIEATALDVVNSAHG
jgi:hypothetical protein